MSMSPRAGRPAEPSDLANIPRLMTAYYTLRPDSGGPGATGGLRDLGAPRLRLRRRVQRGAHPRHHPGDLRLPSGAGDRRAALPRHRHPRAVRAGASRAPSRCWRRTACTVDDRRRAATRRRPRSPTPSSRTTGAGRRGLADGIVDHAVAQPARGRRLQVQPAERRARPTRTSPRWIEDRANALLAADLEGVERIPFERARRAADHAPSRLPGGLRRRSRRSVIDLDAIRGGAADARASIRWAAPACTTGAAIAERYGLALTVVSDDVDPTFRFMTLDWDGKIRMDCSSPYAMQRLIALQGPLRRRLGLRHRPRPARHRHPERRAAEPEPLPRGRHRLPLRAPPRLAGGRRRSARRSSAAA